MRRDGIVAWGFRQPDQPDSHCIVAARCFGDMAVFIFEDPYSETGDAAILWGLCGVYFQMSCMAVSKADIASLDGIHTPHVLRVREICACGYDCSPLSDPQCTSFFLCFRESVD